ncbi:protein lifeguard 4-like [Pseudomyrmex gracilis]|uniref:protein lifeguard 4-like n=1 Tax=Pseudomyrmex gracilis TaxID=219809 RepID=UPI000995CBD7|nr:protein lifeguard 4-like [Pseudomyrmex gracilis]XP_020290083.1 protein lifeguard 4-like [Pseudomyrmex gracilis]
MTTQPLIFVEEDVEKGGKEQAEHEIQNDFAYRNNVHNADIKIRMGFLRKVYGLLSIQLLMTFAIGAVFILNSSVKLYVQENSWTIGLAFFSTLGILIALMIKRKDHPANLILLGAFTLTQAYTVGVMVSMFEVTIVLEALFITLTVVLGLTAYTFQSKRDFSFLGFGLFIGLWCLLLGGLFQIFLQSTAMELAISVGGAILFCLFIVFDTQAIMHNLSPEEYILATINLYLDIINLFLHILRALAISKQ